nr:reverse transcriptase domain-containing protein [Tanacetum cinerariifolium]
NCYPLPEIDWKVESLCGYPFKCFLDAYKGYHQIQVAKLNKEKTAFHTGQGMYCYTKMPFGLKNANTTYRLMDKAFDSQIEMDLFSFIQVADPTKVKVGERECAKEEARILDSTVGRVVPLLPVSSAHT